VNDIETVTLWRPTGKRNSNSSRRVVTVGGPHDCRGSPSFYPVLNKEYACKIARDWNAPRSGVGYVTRFAVRRDFVERYEIQQVGGRTILEYWIPAEDLEVFNDNIVGVIEVIAEYRPESL
jgi:hypothetical protein